MATSKTVSIKLLIDTNANRVLFAESGKDFVDFLFSFLSLPVGTLVRLLTAGGMVGCLGNLYKSVENMEDTYMLSVESKNTILKPSVPNHGTEVPLLMPEVSSTPTNTKLYRCNSDLSLFLSCRTYYANRLNAHCPGCNGYTSIEMKPIDIPTDLVSSAESSNRSGFVKGVVTYMIMDNLEVSPMSTISSIAMLNKFQVKEVGALQEKTVELGMNEGVKLLKSALESSTVLSDVFLAKKSKASV